MFDKIKRNALSPEVTGDLKDAGIKDLDIQGKETYRHKVHKRKVSREVKEIGDWNKLV